MSVRILFRARTGLQRRFASTTSSTNTDLVIAKAKANAFITEREAMKKHAGESSELWKKLSLYGIPPFLLLGSINAYNLWNEHWEHWEHMPPLPERPEYPYQNIRTKNFFWGDGDQSLFWNDFVNYHKQD